MQHLTSKNLRMHKYIIILSLFLFSNCAKYKEPISHSCPEAGHGPCYLCEDPKSS